VTRKLPQSIAAAVEAAGGRVPKRNKYRSRKVIIDGITFHSEAEGEFYKLLLVLLGKKLIEAFDRQPVFPLYAGIKYIADFRIKHNDGEVEVVDCKGKMTDIFRLKRRLYDADHDAPILLVRARYSTRGGKRCIVGWDIPESRLREIIEGSER